MKKILLPLLLLVAFQAQGWAQAPNGANYVISQLNYTASGGNANSNAGSAQQLTGSDSSYIGTVPSALNLTDGGALFTLYYYDDTYRTPNPLTTLFVSPTTYQNIAAVSLAGDSVSANRTRADIGYIVGYDMSGYESIYGVPNTTTGAIIPSILDARRLQYTGINLTGTGSTLTTQRLANTYGSVPGGDTNPTGSAQIGNGLPDDFFPLPANGVANPAETSPPLIAKTSGVQPVYPPYLNPTASFPAGSLLAGSTGSGTLFQSSGSSQTQLAPPAAQPNSTGWSEAWGLSLINSSNLIPTTSPINVFPPTTLTMSLPGVNLKQTGTITLPLSTSPGWPPLTITISNLYPSSRYVVVITPPGNNGGFGTPFIAPLPSGSGVVDTLNGYTPTSGRTFPYLTNPQASYNVTLTFQTYTIFGSNGSGQYKIEVFDEVPFSSSATTFIPNYSNLDVATSLTTALLNSSIGSVSFPTGWVWENLSAMAGYNFTISSTITTGVNGDVITK